MFAIRQAEARTLSWWYTRRDSIDMLPPYQRRGGIWSAVDQSFLIDSILNGYDIPKVYVADFSFRDSPLNLQKTEFAMVDGKQRFEAIFGFFEGSVLLDKEFVYLNDPSMRIAGLGYRDLKVHHPRIAEIFENYNLSVMSIITDEVDRIGELFVRLNRNKSLTGAEVRNAMAGPLPGLFREIAAHPFFERHVRFNVIRGQDLNAAAKLLMIEFRNELVDLKKTNLDQFVKEAVRLEAPVYDFELAAKRVLRNLDSMSEIFAERDPLLSSQGPVVVYYWFVRLLEAHSRLGVRKFLVEFERDRSEHRARLRRMRDQQLTTDIDVDGQSSSIDPELVQYDNFNRSTNDESSLKGRVEILLTRYKDWNKVQDAALSTAGDQGLSERKN